MSSRSDPRSRQASLLLSGLVLTPDEALEVFRDRRAADTSLELEHLKRARDILDFVNLAITEAEPQRWQRLEQAWSLLSQPLDESPSAAAATPRDSDGPAPPPRLDSAPPDSEHAVTTSDTDPTEQVAPVPKPAAPSPAPVSPAPVSPAPMSPAPPSPAPPSPAPPAVPGRVVPAALPTPPPTGSRAAPSAASPWSKSSSSAPDPMPPPVAPAVVAPPASAAARAAASATIDVDQLRQRPTDLAATLDQPLAQRIEVLPFKGKVAQPPPSAVSSDDEGDDDPLMKTAYIESARKPATTLPFKAVAAPADAKPDASSADDPPALPAHLSSMSIEQYAALCAECAVHSRWAKEIAARYGVNSEEEKKAVDAHFGARMARDPKLSETWRFHYGRIEQWARQQKT